MGATGDFCGLEVWILKVNLLKNFYWSVVDLQCGVNFWCTANWFSYMCVCINIYVFLILIPTVVYYRILNIISSAIYTARLCCLSIIPLCLCAHTHTHTQLFVSANPKLPWWLHQLENPPVMQETQIQSLGGKGPLEKGMAPHSSILAWEVPWTEEPGGLGVAKSRTRLKQLNHHQCQTLSPSVSHHCLWQPQICSLCVCVFNFFI